ncbi:MAG: UDP-N-acetylmuramate--L-alanine ligase [Planctomycetota bacterium]
MDNIRNVHFVGIGGIGMSGIARILLKRGCAVSGSDIRDSHILDSLRDSGAKIYTGHNPDNIPASTQLVVRSEAARPSNPEIARAASGGIPVMTYAECLGELMRHYRGVAVAGTHGKTTTTAMIVAILRQAGLDPSFVIGGETPWLGGASALGKGDLFVAEACEYHRSFHSLKPEIALINNIEEDHLDYYSGIEEITDAFGLFVEQIPENGLLVFNADDERAMHAAEWRRCEARTFALNRRADWTASEISSSFGFTSFRAHFRGAPWGRFCLKMSGLHNVANALAAMAVTEYLGTGEETMVQAFAAFPGVRRRFEELGEVNGVTVVDDYAHHPTAIRATLYAARLTYPGKKIWCVFQPHQHSRTRHLLKDFARSFGEADCVIVPDIYFVRDSLWETGRVSAEDLVREISLLGGSAKYIPDFDGIMKMISSDVRPGDLLLTMGAGNIHEVAHRLVGESRPAKLPQEAVC